MKKYFLRKFYMEQSYDNALYEVYWTVRDFMKRNPFANDFQKNIKRKKNTE
jgi:hypothetical protein